MSDQEEKITQFSSITGADETRARFYLDSAAWQLEVAIARYYENDGEESDTVEVPSMADSPRSPVSVKKPKPKGKPSNFATINTINSSSEEEEEEGQAYYAGGSETSGQQVLGPPKKKDFVADMFKSVQEHGVEILEPSASTSSSRAFRGTGYKLGQDDNDSVAVPGVPEPMSSSEVTLRLWQNGFTVNDSELRHYTDPANKEFLDSIRQGEIPQELRRGASEVHLAMEDHRMEAFRQSKIKLKAFQGHGYTLGSPAPTVVGTCKEEDKPNNEAKAKEQLKLDSSQPTTNLQIRLADGSRLVGQFNHEHTIGEIRNFIQTARPQYQNQSFNLMSSYPSKILDDTQTIAAAGLLNSAIMQKLV
ncbi:NSFL1 cofactor p47 isoform X1 [Diabrotica undecimpunctata]|uniref:NSFL1 cofactor p47 isoform X1 n=2 Tax=Diabrotica undecimpunctata TaxID=50387 RepID=UPI003B6342D0